MRILFAIAHYWKPPSLTTRAAAQLRHIPVARAQRLGRRFMPRHGSMGLDADERARALADCIANLHTLFASPQGEFDRNTRTLVAANAQKIGGIDVIVCTSGSDHLLERLDIQEGFHSSHASAGDPRHLSFECQEVLKAGLGSYDFYCFLEDDILLHDASFFEKLRWFGATFGERALLQPNRFERSRSGPVRKLYIDEVIPAELTDKFQDISRDNELSASCMNARVVFRRPANPHSGCYFLSAAQMEYWAGQPYFGARDEGFVGPLESGASLGIMRTFNIYKPALDDASFLEVEHYGDAYLRRRVAELYPET